MKPKLAIVLGFLIAVGVIVFIAVNRKGEDKQGPVQPVVDPSKPPPPPPAGKAVEVTLEYSTEKKEWLEAAVVELEKAHPEVKVKLVGKGSLDAAAAILDGTDKPVMWSPADSLIANLLASDWSTKQGSALFPTTGDAGPQPLLLSPLVFAVWEDRAKVLIDASAGQLSWKTIHKAVASPKGWPAIGGKPAWGFVKLGHTDPNRSNSGVQALLLMALEYFGSKTVTIEQMLDPKFQDFVKEIEAAVQKFEPSTGTFMTDMIRFGPSKYDIAVVYESLAVSQLENAQGRWGSLHIYYPPVTIWSDHPIVILDGPWVTAEQRKAAEVVVAFLRSPKVQATALRFGFRPADTSVPMKSNDAANPFSKMAQYGLTLELPPAAPAADGAVVRNLLMMWSRVVRK
ncbi:MAG: substrate-binding domain-containing protein [Kofleriaceae bacterium]